MKVGMEIGSFFLLVFLDYTCEKSDYDCEIFMHACLFVFTRLKGLSMRIGGFLLIFLR